MKILLLYISLLTLTSCQLSTTNKENIIGKKVESIDDGFRTATIKFTDGTTLTIRSTEHLKYNYK